MKTLIKESQNLLDRVRFNQLTGHKFKCLLKAVQPAFVDMDGDQITIEESYIGLQGEPILKVVSLQDLEDYFTEWATEEIDHVHTESDEAFQEFINLYPSKGLAKHALLAYWFKIYKKEWIENLQIIEREKSQLVANS